MAVPKKKKSRARRDNRRSHDAISAVASYECPNCGENKLPHHVCRACGHYNEREVIATKAA